MPDYTVINLKRDVEDMAPKFGLSPGLESRFARVPLELQNSGASYFKIAPGFRAPFGHSHSEQEEVYLVISGSARIKLDDEIIDLEQWDVLRIAPQQVRRHLFVEDAVDGLRTPERFAQPREAVVRFQLEP